MSAVGGGAGGLVQWGTRVPPPPPSGSPVTEYVCRRPLTHYIRVKQIASEIAQGHELHDNVDVIAVVVRQPGSGTHHNVGVRQLSHQLLYKIHRCACALLYIIACELLHKINRCAGELLFIINRCAVELLQTEQR